MAYDSAVMSSSESTPLVGPPHIPFSAADYAADGKHHLLLAATGSVATIKLPLIAKTLADRYRLNLSIRILLTPAATNFLQSQSSEQPSLSSLLAIPNVDGIYLDHDEWAKPWVRGDPILHVELRRWAHLLLIAPLSANSLAKIANGLCDGLLLSVVRAWDTTGLIDPVDRPFPGSQKGVKKRIFVAPAMNTSMWRHPITTQQIQMLEESWGATGQVSEGVGNGVVEDGQGGVQDGWITVLMPAEKELACGDVGVGAMMDWKDIVARVEQYLGLEPSTL